MREKVKDISMYYAYLAVFAQRLLQRLSRQLMTGADGSRQQQYGIFFIIILHSCHPKFLIVAGNCSALRNLRLK